MALLDKAIEEASKYISLKDFLCYTAYKLDEPIKDIVSYLLYNQFDDVINECSIDRHCRITLLEDADRKTTAIFDEISKDGFCSYMMFCASFFDDCPSANSDLDFYTPIEIDFYYSLEQLQQLPFIKSLSLSLENAKTLDYSVNTADMVSAKEPKDGIRTFKLMELTRNNDIREEDLIIEEYGKNSQAHNLFRALTEISNDTNKIPAPTVTQTDKQVIAKLREQLVALTTKNDKLNEQLNKANAALAAANTSQPSEDKLLVHSSQAAVARLLNVLFNKAGYDLDAHSGTTNAQIISYSNRPDVNTPITKGFLVPWIKRVQQLRIDTEMR